MKTKGVLLAAAVREFLQDFGPDIDDDRDMNGADTVDRVAYYVERFREVLGAKED